MPTEMETATSIVPVASRYIFHFVCCRDILLQLLLWRPPFFIYRRFPRHNSNEVLNHGVRDSLHVYSVITIYTQTGLESFLSNQKIIDLPQVSSKWASI